MNEFDLRRQLQALQAPRSPGRDLWPDVAARIERARRAAAPAAHSSRRRRGEGRGARAVALAASLVMAVVIGGGLWLRPAAERAGASLDDPRNAQVLAAPAPAMPPAGRQPRPADGPRHDGLRSDALLVQADALTLEYIAALEQVGGAGLPRSGGGLGPALADLDRSAGEIRSALRDAPRAEFLLAQLRRTYAQRLRLTQEALAS